MSDRDQEELLHQVLNARAEELPPGGHADLGAVRAGARRIRRRRQAVVGAAAAVVVVAVAVPVGVVWLRSGSTPDGLAARPSPVASASTVPTPTTSPSDVPTAPTSVAPGVPSGSLTAAGISSGPSPRIAYLRSGTYVRPDGTTVPLGDPAYVAVTPYHGGFLAAANHGGTVSVDRLDTTMKVASSAPGSASFAVSIDQLQTGFFRADPQPTLYSGVASGMGQGEATLSLPEGTAATPVGFLQGDRLVYDVAGTHPQVQVTGFNGSPSVIPGLLRAVAVSGASDLVAGQLSASPGGSCWAVVSASTGEALWKTCDHRLGRFSPDGRFLLAGPAYGDGLGDSSLAVLDVRDGSVVASFDRPGGSDLFVADTTWEQTGQVLAVVHESGAWRVLRLGLDGSVQAATEPVPGAETDRPLYFAATP